MAHEDLSQSLFCLQLQSGQTAWEILPHAANITVMEGSIVVHQRLLLADTWVHLPVVLHAGEQWRLRAGEWVGMEAMASARVHAISAQTWWQFGWLGRALQRLRPASMASWRQAA